MANTADPGGSVFTVDGQGNIVPALPPGVTQAQIDASLAANPNASKGGYEGVGTAANPGPDGQTNYGTGQPDPATSTAPSTTDWASFLGLYGLPADLQSKIADIFAKNPDVTQATQLALAYVRGTPWYAQTYPGIQEGIARGVITNEAGYRDYMNKANVLTRQYLGRDVSGSEIAGFLSQGYDVDRIGRIYQGGATVKANGADWRYLTGAFDENGPLTDAEQTALGQEQAGIDTELGQRVQRRLALAQQRLQGVFGGTAATPSLSLTNGRLSAPSLGGSAAPDTAA